MLSQDLGSNVFFLALAQRYTIANKVWPPLYAISQNSLALVVYYNYNYYYYTKCFREEMYKL